jgi:thymidine kinase
MNKKMNGYLELILGPMFSGKTSKILDLYKQCEFSNIPVVVINHTSDKRYSETMLSTHDLKMIPCIQASSLCDAMEILEIKNKINDATVILINEGQFFNDLYEWTEMMVETNHKEIYICGLDGDFNRNKFGQILDLIPLCDKVTKLKSLCSMCKNGTKALFSLRVTEEKEQVLIGSDCYKPVCRACYNKYHKNKII